MKPFETWPDVLDAKGIEEFIEVSRSDAQAILKYGPVINPDKAHARKITKGRLKKYLEE